MKKLTVKFDTRAISPDVDPSRSYTLHLLDRPVYDESQVFREVVKEKTLPFDEDMLKFAFLCVLKTMTQKVAADCIPRKIGNHLKFLPTIRGKVKGPYSPYDPKTCSTAIVVQSLSGLEKVVNMDYIQFVNVRQGVKAVVRKVTWRGAEETGKIMPGRQIRATGDNLLWLDGDSVELSWKLPDGTEATATVTSIVEADSDVDNIILDWPDALDGVATGTEVKFRFLLRGGIEDAEPQPSDVSATVIEAEPGPGPTPTGPTVTAINGGGVFYAGDNRIEGTNIRFADAHPASHIVLKNGEGQAVTGVELTDQGTASETEFHVIVADNEGTLADGADYTWEFAMVDSENNPVTVTKTARWVSE